MFGDCQHTGLSLVKPSKINELSIQYRYFEVTPLEALWVHPAPQRWPWSSNRRPFGSLWVPLGALGAHIGVPLAPFGFPLWSSRRPGSLKCSQIETPKPGKDPCVCSPLTHGSFSGIVRVPLVTPRLPLGSLYRPLVLPCDQYLSSISVVSHTWSRPRAARPKTTRHARKMIELP